MTSISNISASSSSSNSAVRLDTFNQSQCSTLNDEETEIALIIAAQKGDAKAMNKLLADNMGWIATCAKNYLGMGVSKEELIHCGRIGLSIAIMNYNPSFGAKLISYATHFINNEMRAIVSETCNIIQLPRGLITTRGKIFDFIEEYAIKHDGARPCNQVIADQLGIKVNKVQDILSCSFTKSLDEPISSYGEDDDFVVADKLDDAYGFISPEDCANQDMTREVIKDTLKSHLSERDELIISDKFGLSTGEEESLTHIATEVGMSIEGVRKVVNKSTKKLAQSVELRELFAA